MTSLTVSKTASWLLEHDHYLILSHRRPDGDTIGSSAALCRGLRKLGKHAHILRNMEITSKYCSLHADLNKECPEAGDIMICVDVAAPELLPESVAHLRDGIALRIDHHASASSFTEQELVDPKAAACGQIIYSLLMEMGVALDASIADALYTAISTDTGCFRYANTTVETFRVAAACADAGARIFEINHRLFETKSLGRLRLESWMIDHAQFFGDGRMVICAIGRDVEEALGLTEEDMENISGFPRSIEGIQMAATLRQDGEKIKVSVRAVPGYDAAAVCAVFGGGGHKGAAGASICLSMEEAIQTIRQAMEMVAAQSGIIG